jgi:predicted metal-dependent HD superfamily phosphohydrolase
MSPSNPHAVHSDDLDRLTEAWMHLGPRADIDLAAQRAAATLDAYTPHWRSYHNLAHIRDLWSRLDTAVATHATGGRAITSEERALLTIAIAAHDTVLHHGPGSPMDLATARPGHSPEEASAWWVLSDARRLGVDPLHGAALAMLVRVTAEPPTTTSATRGIQHLLQLLDWTSGLDGEPQHHRERLERVRREYPCSQDRWAVGRAAVLTPAWERWTIGAWASLWMMTISTQAIANIGTELSELGAVDDACLLYTSDAADDM